MKNRKRIYLLLVLLICINTINVYASENIDISLSTESDQENTTEVPLDETIDNNFEIMTDFDTFENHNRIGKELLGILDKAGDEK